MKVKNLNFTQNRVTKDRAKTLLFIYKETMDFPGCDQEVN